jgi:hypothetical protein
VQDDMSKMGFIIATEFFSPSFLFYGIIRDHILLTSTGICVFGFSSFSALVAQNKKASE